MLSGADDAPSTMVADFAGRVVPLVCKLRRLLANHGNIVAVRLALSPMTLAMAGWSADNILEAAIQIDNLSKQCGCEFVGGFCAFADRGISGHSKEFLKALPFILLRTSTVCAFVQVASTTQGIRFESIRRSAEIIKMISSGDPLPADSCARLAVCCNNVPDIPFMPLGFHDPHAPDCINIGIGMIDQISKRLRDIDASTPLETVCELIECEATRVSQSCETIGLELAQQLDISLGAIDISLAPEPHDYQHSILALFATIGVERLTQPGSIAVLAMLNDSLKKGGLSGSRYVRGLSGSFISVSEDLGIFENEKFSHLLDRLYALSSVCSVGIDMVAIPSATSEDTIVGLIADEMAIGCRAGKTTSVRLIPIGVEGETVHFTSSEWFGRTRVIKVSPDGGSFSHRTGHIPPFLQSFSS